MQPIPGDNPVVPPPPAEPASAPPAPPPLPDTPAPPPTAARIESIDVLRGFALLGILVVNIQAFAMIEAAYFTPTAYGDFSGVNFVVWLLTHTLADQKFMTIFSMLFGAGIILMTGNRERAGRSPAAAHYRRMLVLLAFGLAHAYGLWYGDILVAYALCGMIAYPLRRVRSSILLPLGIALLSVASILSLLGGWSTRFWPADQVADFNAQIFPPPQVVAAELAAYRSGWLRQMDYRAPAALMMQTYVFAVWGGWRVLGLMLMGMVLFRNGVFSAACPTRYYLRLIAIGLFAGVPLVLYGVHRNFAVDWNPTWTFFIGSQFNYWASLLVSAGWIGAVMLLCKAGPRFTAITGPLAAVGRLALTNYLLQTLICTTVFYGHGLGLFGKVQRIGQFAIVAGIWALQLILSPLYLKHFRIGPAEWLWRTLTYLKAPQFRRAEANALLPGNA